MTEVLDVAMVGPAKQGSHKRCREFVRPTAGRVDGQLGSAPGSAQRFLTPNEAATYLGGLNHRTVTRWAREGYSASNTDRRGNSQAVALSGAGSTYLDAGT